MYIIACVVNIRCITVLSDGTIKHKSFSQPQYYQSTSKELSPAVTLLPSSMAVPRLQNKADGQWVAVDLPSVLLSIGPSQETIILVVMDGTSSGCCQRGRRTIWGWRRDYNLVAIIDYSSASISVGEDTRSVGMFVDGRTISGCGPLCWFHFITFRLDWVDIGWLMTNLLFWKDWQCELSDISTI